MVDFRSLQTLKILAQHGADKSFIPLTTTQLAEWLSVSQQSASNRLRGLLEGKLVERRWGHRANQVMLTKAGLSALYGEYNELRAIFEEAMGDVELTGTLVSGIGEGKYYITHPGYSKQFKARLGFVPRFGTFNLRLDPKDLPRFNHLRERPGLAIDQFVSEGRTFGPGKCFRAKIGDVECAVMIPSRSHYTDILEVISRDNLRQARGVKDGDRVRIVISSD